MKTLPKIVKFIKYHWRHCAIFNPADNNKHLFEASENFAHRHARPHDSTPQEKCWVWLKENGYHNTNEGDALKTGEFWQLTTS